MAQDHYATLNVQPDASAQEVKKAFRKIARTCHPDVSGDNPDAEKRFIAARAAYEVLCDPVKRARYDRRLERRRTGGMPSGGGSFFDAFYRATAKNPDRRPPGGRMNTGRRARSSSVHFDDGNAGKVSGGLPRGSRTGKNNPGNAVSLDDLFNDFGFGSKGSAPKPKAPPPRRHRSTPRRGEDIAIDVQVPRSVAKKGGAVSVRYVRRIRDERWRIGTPGTGLVSTEESTQVRVVPDTRQNDRFTQHGMGHLGACGGPPGDLLVTVTLTDDPKPKEPPVEPKVADSNQELLLKVSMVEAVLGGRVQLHTPTGSVRLTIPPGTSGGSKFRLKGKGLNGADVYAIVQIQIPKNLDAQSLKLMEQFALLNP